MLGDEGVPPDADERPGDGSGLESTRCPQLRDESVAERLRRILRHRRSLPRRRARRVDDPPRFRAAAPAVDVHGEPL